MNFSTQNIHYYFSMFQTLGLKCLISFKINHSYSVGITFWIVVLHKFHIQIKSLLTLIIKTSLLY